MYFNPNELAFIERCAQKAVILDGLELTVATVVNRCHAGSMTALQLRIVDFCAGECCRQKSGALSVHWMVTAYEYASEFKEPLSIYEVLELGVTVEPKQNYFGFATVPARFSTADIAQVRDPRNIHRQVESLLTHGGDLSPLQLYVYFEEIHPFNDGNGRVGAILYNLRNRSLDQPLIPPRIDFQAFKVNRNAPVETFIIQK